MISEMRRALRYKEHAHNWTLSTARAFASEAYHSNKRRRLVLMMGCS